jgi:phosphoribosylanthranilate isomerase
MTTKVKICGITHARDAELAVEQGAWAIGLVFYPGSPRACEADAAVEIGAAVKRRTEVAGVFVNAPLDDVARMAEAASLTMIQLHGEEGPSYCREASRRTGLKVIKAARVRDAASVRVLSAYKTDFHMLDAYVPGTPGGTGERFDWALAAEDRSDIPLIVAGGITPENVREAIEAASPFAVDVSSGVEVTPGRKDPEQLARLFEAIRDGAPARV